MNALGITLSIFVGLIVIFIGFQMVYEFIWNKRLSIYQKKNNISHLTKKTNYDGFLRRSLIALTSVVMLFVLVVTGSFDLPQIFHDKTLLNAKIVQDEKTLRNKLNAGNGFYFDNFGPESGDTNLDESSGDQASRDVVGTNIQVDGVDESDIIKTDGFEIFYTPRYQSNRVYKYKVESNGDLTKLKGLEFEDFYISEFYLTEDYLVIIGYKIEVLQTYYFGYDNALIMPDYYFNSYRYTSNVRIYDRDTLSLNYDLLTTSDIQTHRIIDNMLYMVAYNSIYAEELRPSFTETVNGESQTSYVEYDQILIFDQIPAYQIITVSAINLDTHQTHHEAVVGVSGYMYMDHDAIYIAGIFSYYPFMNTVIDGTHIMKFNLNHEAGTVTYSASTILEGYVFNQFWMDAYEGYLRVVTSLSWGSNDRNRLYILKENDATDNLDHIGLLDKGIGKPEERVTSVRFDKNLAYVVTYRQIDPLYTIDLSNPKDIKIINEVEEPGYNTYLHVWDENHLIGIGYDENFNVKISAYGTTNTAEPLETFQLSQPNDGHYVWSYSEALNNHKAILISPTHGFVGFAINKHEYSHTLNEYLYTSSYYLFYIDFEADPIIQTPHIIEHETTNYSNFVDRGIYINNIFYTFSSSSIVIFNGETKQIEQTYPLREPMNTTN